MGTLHLRPGQQQAAAYQGGGLAIAAVPGSGKTFTLEVLISHLITDQGIPAHRIGVFTYMRSSRANLIQRINQRLNNQGVLIRFRDAFTLHSLSLRILKEFQHRLSRPSIQMLEHYQQDRLLQRLTRSWLNYHPEEWEPRLPVFEDPYTNRRIQNRFSQSFLSMCGSVIRTAKNYRIHPEMLIPAEGAFLRWVVPIYQLYQGELDRLERLDYDDLGWKAVDLLASDDALLKQVQDWYDFLLEDEAQDSSPLQNELLQLLSGRTGNLVRVGDPNQSIMGTFTTAEPALFRDFCQQYESVVLEESSRSAPRILALANQYVNWVTHQHPQDQLRTALVPQFIQVASTGPENPPDSDVEIEFYRVQGSPDQEMNFVTRLALQKMQQDPEQTLVILVPTNELGLKALTSLQYNLQHSLSYPHRSFKIIDYLRGNPSQKRVILPLWQSAHYFAHPSSSQRLKDLVEILGDWCRIPASEMPPILTWVGTIPPERILDPWQPISYPSVGSTALKGVFEMITSGLKSVHLPWQDALGFLVQNLYRTPEDLWLGHYVLMQLDRILDPQADWQQVADEIRILMEGKLNSLPTEGSATTIEPGSITVSTTHRAKGLEWDHVFITGMSAYEYPTLPQEHLMGLQFLNNTDLQAEALAELRGYITGKRGSGSATEEAFFELASERLRLLYVAITRAKRKLVFTVATQDQFEREQKPSALFDLLQFLQKAETKKIQGS
jgi:DNA helicase-2/ATP-dependent DNA helicase PcrA